MLRAAALFGIGYVLGAKAGRERYVQMRTLAQKAASAMDERRREISANHSRPG